MPTVLPLLRVASLFAVAVAFSVAVGTAVAATPAEESEALIKRANKLRVAGDDQGALPLFRRAVELHRSPRTLGQLGLVEHALGRWADADEHLTAALKVREDPWIAQNLSVLEGVLGEIKQSVGRVEITGEPGGAEVLVNGRVVGRVPLAEPIRVNAGTVDIEVRAPGYRPMLRTLAVSGRQTQQVVIRLEREEPTAASPPAGGARSLVADTPPEPGAWRPWVILGTAAGAALAVGGGLFAMTRHNRDVDRFNESGCFEAMGKLGYTGGGAGSVASCSQLNSSYKRARTLSLVGFGAAAALGTTALVLHLTRPGGNDSRTALGVCAPDLSRPGLACALRF